MKKVFITIIGLSIIVLTAVIFVLLTRQKSQTLYISDIVMQNVNGLGSLSNRKDTKKAFFTGSSIAEVNLQTDSGKLQSTSKTADYAFNNVQSWDYNTNTSSLLLNIVLQYDSPLRIRKSNNQLVAPPRQLWVLQNNKTLKEYNPNNNKIIYDAKFHRDGIVFLAGNENSRSLIYDDNNNLKIISDNTSVNKITGVFNNTVVVRDQKGVTYVFDSITGSNWTINTNTENVFIDEDTQSIIVQDKTTPTQLTQYLSKDKKKTIKVPYEKIIVNDGYVLSLNKKIKPSEAAVINLKNYKTVTFNKFQYSNERVADSIYDFVVIQDEPLALGIITEFDSLMIASLDHNFTTAYQIYTYPDITYSLGKYDLGTSSLQIYSNNVEKSVLDIKNNCRCDINQIKKSWIVDGDGNQPES